MWAYGWEWWSCHAFKPCMSILLLFESVIKLSQILQGTVNGADLEMGMDTPDAI